MQKNIHHLLVQPAQLLSFVLVTILLTGCNSAQQLPTNSRVVVEPGNREIVITELRDDNDNCIWFEGNYLDTPVSIRVVNGDDSPIGESDLAIYVDWSGNTFPGVQALKLYDDTNGNGVVDDPEELVSGNGDAIFTTKTSKYNGDKTVLLRMNLSCEFEGNLYALSGGKVGSMAVNIQADNKDNQQ